MSLQEVFKAYSKNSPEMDGRTFSKLLKDTGIIDSKFTSAQADVVFCSMKKKGTKKLLFEDFERALTLVAEKKNVPKDTVIARVLEEGVEGPILYATKAENVRLFDDKSTYTATQKQGGATTVDNKFSDLSQLCDRSSANVRGVNQEFMINKMGVTK